MLFTAVLLGLLGWTGRGPPRWVVPRWAGAAGLGLAALLLLIAATGAPGAHGLHHGVVTTADFDEYCGATALLRDGRAWAADAPWPAKRSRLAGGLAGLLAGPLGILDGLLAQAALGMVAMILATAVWAGRLGGPAAAALAVVVLGGLGPTLLLPRMASFYGTQAAAGTVAAAAVAVAVVDRRRGPSRWAAVLVWLPVLIDLRGILWTAPLALLLIAGGRCRGWVLGWGAVAWGLGRVAYAADTLPLEVQAWQAANVLDFDAGGRPPEALHTHGFVWGRSALVDLPRTVWTLATLPRAAPGSRAALDPHVLPGSAAWQWLGLAAGSLIVAVPQLRRRSRWALLAAVPGLVLWVAALQSDLAEPRLLVGAGPALAVVTGLGLAGRGRRGLAVGAVGLALLLVPASVGLSWQADWRPRVQAREGHIGRLLHAARTASREQGALRETCVAALREDHARGHPAGSRWLGPVRQVGGPPERAGRRRGQTPRGQTPRAQTPRAQTPREQGAREQDRPGPAR